MILRRALFALILGCIVFTVTASSQDVKPEPEASPVATPQPSALQQLGLTRDQMRQVRQINQARKPVMEEAQRRLKDANHALDETIYGDQVNDGDVQARIKDLQAAQAEVARVRFTSELAIRKVLTPEQLTRFRGIRQQFEKDRQASLQKSRQAAGIKPQRAGKEQLSPAGARKMERRQLKRPPI